MISKVVHNNHITETFPITCGLKQGCVLALTLFSIYLAAMLYELPPDNPSIDMRYHIDGSLFNAAPLRSTRHTTVFSLNNLQFADNMAAVASSPEDLERSVSNFTSAYERFGLTVNIGKTKVLLQNTLENEEPVLNIRIWGKEVEHVTQFSYLGAVLSAEATSGKDVEKRIQAANVAYGRLGKRVLQNRDLLRTTKLMVYKAVVLTVLLYGCETWTLHMEDLKKLERFHQRKLKAIMNIRWQVKVSNISVLKRGRSQSMEAIVALHQLRWAGHIRRMPEERLPKRVLYCELTDGRRRIGAPCKPYKDQLKSSLKVCNIGHNNWETDAADRVLWRKRVKAGVAQFENEKERTERKKEIRKAVEGSTTPPSTTHTMPKLPRLFYSRIGLASQYIYFSCKNIIFSFYSTSPDTHFGTDFRLIVNTTGLLCTSFSMWYLCIFVLHLLIVIVYEYT